MPLAGLILNRVQKVPAAHLSAARSLAAAEVLQGSVPGAQGGRGAAARTAVQLDEPEAEARLLTIAALRLHAERMEQAAAQRRTAGQFTAAHPLVPVAEVPAQAEDVHDLEGLRRIGLAFENGR
jgi:hypothetical protein